MSLCSCQGGSSSALCPALSFCRGGLSSVCARPCGSVGAVCAWSASVPVALSGRFASVCARSCGSVGAVCPRLTRGLAILSGRFASVHACCLSCDKQDGLRDVAFLFRRVEIAIRTFSQRRYGYLPWQVHFGFGCLFVAISTGCRRTGYGATRGTGMAARPLCAFARAH